MYALTAVILDVSWNTLKMAGPCFALFYKVCYAKH